MLNFGAGKAAGFILGVSDYLAKSFSSSEVIPPLSCTCSAKTACFRYAALGLNHRWEHSLLQAEKVGFVMRKSWSHHPPPYRAFWMEFHLLPPLG